MNFSKKNISLFILCAVLFSHSLFAQSFKSSVDRTTVGTNERFQVDFTFEGGNGADNFTPPTFRGFKVLSGPNQSSSMQIINGDVTASITYSFWLIASEVGKETIGPASVTYKGKIYRTKPVEITVVKGKAPSQKGNGNNGETGLSDEEISKNLFILAQPNKRNVYQGEEVLVTYKLYVRMSISTPTISKVPTYPGFWAEDLETDNNLRMSSEMYKGERYKVAVLKKVALYPTKTGKLTTTPFELTVPIIVKKKRRSGDPFDEFFNDSFFGRRETVEYLAKSNSLSINVKPLPEAGKPESFNGAVGEFTFTSSIDNQIVKANEPVTIKLAIEGRGNISLINPPEIKLPAGFEKYEPKTTEKTSKNNYVSGKKMVEYLVVPRIEGKKTIAPIEFSYFNPATKKYTTVSSPEFSLEVTPGDKQYTSAGGGITKTDVKYLSEDIRFIKTAEANLLRKEEVELIGNWFWVLSALQLLGFFGFIAFTRHQAKMSGDVQLLKYKKAEKVAKAKLKKAKIALDAGNIGEYYNELSSSLYGYLEDKLAMQKADFTRQKALDELKQRGVAEDYISKLEETLDKCEFVRFAPQGENKASAQGIYNATVELIVKLDESISSKR